MNTIRFILYKRRFTCFIVILFGFVLDNKNKKLLFYFVLFSLIRTFDLTVECTFARQLK